jgi:hypothetical protein
MTPFERHPPGLPAALPADHDDDDGGAASARLPLTFGERRRARSCAGRSASPWSAASRSRQILTLYTTPVIYLYLETPASA